MSSPLLLMAPCLAHLSILMPAQSPPEPTDASNPSIVHVATAVCSDDDSGTARAVVVNYPDGTIEAVPMAETAR
jgi:hypothetical protein